MSTNDKFLYGERSAEVRTAAGRKGVLVRTLDGGMVFRVYDDSEHFTDYEIRHDDLGVTIDADELAAFYKVGERDILDNSPQVLGSKSLWPYPLARRAPAAILVVASGGACATG